MSVIATRLRDSRLSLWEQAKVIADQAADENRAFTAEEQGTWETINGQIDALDKRLGAVLEQEKRAAETDAAFDQLAGKPKTGPVGGPDGGFDAQLRKFLLGESGRSLDLAKPAKVDFRALSKLTAAAGLNTVPTAFYDQLMAHLIEVSSIMQTNPTILNTASGESLQIPKTTAHSTAAIVAEAGTIATSEPTFGQITLGAFKYGDLMQVSRELAADTGVDLEGYLAMQVGRALGNALGAHLAVGTGAAQPRGAITDAAVGVTGGAGVAGAFTADNLIDLHYSVIYPYRNSRSCFWLVKDSTLATIRRLKDTTNQYLWQPSLQMGAPDMLLGKPLLTDPFVPAVALSAKSVLFGDFSQYFVRLAGGIRFEQSNDFAFNTDLITYRAILRADAALVDLTGALKVFQGNAA